MIRILLLVLLGFVVLRAGWLLLDGMLEGFAGRTRAGSRVPQRGVQMVRDPVCGTFVVPERAIAITERGSRVFFCSPTCRDKYRSQRTA